MHWLDAHNGVYEEVQGEITKQDNLEIAHIKSDNESIDYRIAILLEPSMTYYQIFGNMENLKKTESTNFDNEERSLLSRIDLNEVAKSLIPEVRNFMSQSSEYKDEVERKKNERYK